MELPSLPVTPVYTDPRLQPAPVSEPGSPDDRLQQVADDFESVFVSMLLKNMRSTVGSEGLFAGDKSDTLGGMFDMFMSEHLSQSDALGIRSMIGEFLDNTNPGTQT